MTISIIDIEAVLQAEDVEGFIALGAPGDEYAPEAKEIASALAGLAAPQLNMTNVIAILSSVWAKYFNLSNEDINKRMPAFQRIANELLLEN